MATMADLDRLALAMPHTTKEYPTTAGPRTPSTASSSAATAAEGATRSIQKAESGSMTCSCFASPIWE
jgi:hypothetical protein